MEPNTPQHMAFIGRLGGLTTRSRHSGASMTAAGRQRFMASFVDESIADPTEREARATASRRLYYARLTAKSVATARARRETRIASARVNQVTRP